MDPQYFDSLIRSLNRAGTRRGALGALIAACVPLLPDDVGARRGRGKQSNGGKGNGKRKDRGKGSGNRGEQGARAEAVPARCFNGSACTPGPGKNLGKCDFGGSPALKNANLKGANLGAANLAKADASGANLTGANLGRTCLVEANLTGATITNSTSIATAVFCRTTMPDGSLNNSGCNSDNRCCQTCIDAGGRCGDGIGGDCCAGSVCVDGACIA